MHSPSKISQILSFSFSSPSSMSMPIASMTIDLQAENVYFGTSAFCAPKDTFAKSFPFLTRSRSCIFRSALPASSLMNFSICELDIPTDSGDAVSIGAAAPEGNTSFGQIFFTWDCVAVLASKNLRNSSSDCPVAVIFICCLQSVPGYSFRAP